MAETAVRGAFIQVPEDCLLRPWDGASPRRAAVVLTTFAVGSVEEVLERVREMGGRTQL